MTIRLLSRCLAWLLALAIAAFTVLSIEFRPMTAAPANAERFAAFMIMGALFSLGYPRHRLRLVWLLLAIAGLLEVLQHLSPGRHARLLDGIVKAAGALLGLAFGAAAAVLVKDAASGTPPSARSLRLLISASDRFCSRLASAADRVGAEPEPRLQGLEAAYAVQLERVSLEADLDPVGQVA